MAGFIAYATKLEGNSLPTPHVVAAFGASAWDVLDFGQTEGAPELLLGGGSDTSSLGTWYSSTHRPFSLVGVQPRALIKLNNDGSPGTSITGPNLSKTIKRIEYRYLANNHLMIRVLINEDTLGTLRADEVWVFEGKALLSSGDVTAGTLTKKSVYFTVNLPVLSNINFDVNVAKYLQGLGVNEQFGKDIQISGGNPNSSFTWNVSRTHQEFTTGLESSSNIPVNNIFPHYANIGKKTIGSRDEQTLFKKFRKMDVIRSSSDPAFYEIGGSTPITFTSTKDTFDLLEYHGMTKGYWGQLYGGFMFTGPTSGTPGYTIVGNSSGSSIGLDTIPSSEYGWSMGDFSGQNPSVNSILLSGEFSFTGDPLNRNLFYPSVSESPFILQLPGSTSAGWLEVNSNRGWPSSSYYLNFFQASGDDISVDSSGHTLTISTTGGDFATPAYSFANAAATTIAAVTNSTGTVVSQLSLINGTGVDWLNQTVGTTAVANPLTAVQFGFMSWQEYIAGCLLQTCTPYHSNTGLTDPFNYDYDLGVSHLRSFSTAFARASGLQKTLNKLRGDGLEISSANLQATEFGGATNSVALNMYTVFVYSDSYAERDLANANPLADGTQNTVFPWPISNGAGNLNLKTWNCWKLQQDNTGQNLHFIPLPRMDAAGNSSPVYTLDNTGYCDPNSSVVFDPATMTRYALNANSAGPTDYNRGNLSMYVDSTGTNNTVEVDFVETELESVIVIPRSITWYEGWPSSQSQFVPSVYYNFWYLGVHNTSDTTATSNTIDGNSANVKWVTTSNNGYSHTLAALGLTSEIDEFYTAEYLDIISINNVFSYVYTPGRYEFTQDNVNNFFIHDQPEQARSFFTLSPGTGIDYLTSPIRQILGFGQDVTNVGATDIRKAHADLSFSQDWESEGVMYSVIQNNCVKTIGDVDGDAPQIRTRKFVVIAAATESDVDDGGDPIEIEGCTDATALNYNPDATVDDGSCVECSLTVNTLDDNADWLPSLSLGLAYSNAISYRSRAGLAANSGMFEEGVMGPEFLGGGANELPWVDGNHVNGFNSTSLALTNGPGNTPNTASSFLQFQFDINYILTVGMISSGTNTNNGLQFINSNVFQQVYNELSADPSDWTLEIYNYSDWDVAPTGEDNGWVQSGFDNMYTTLAQMGLGSATAVAILNNASSNDEIVQFKTYEQPFYGQGNIDGWLNQGVNALNVANYTIIDYGLKAGSQYVGLIKWSPKGVCPLNASGQNNVYYFPINFWIEYCECTDTLANNTGNGAGVVGPGVAAVYAPEFLFPGLNTPSNFCAASLINGSDTGIICTYDPEINTYCDNFFEWCLSNPISDCIQVAGQPSEIQASVSVLIDGFYSGLYPDTAPYTLSVDGVDILYTVNLYEGSTAAGSPIQSIPSHIDGAYNPEIILSAPGTIADTALITFNNLDGIIYTVEVVLTGNYEEYVLDYPCTPYTLTINLAPVDPCDDLTIGCTDPTATNYDETADEDDGSCEYLECDEFFTVSVDQDVFVNNYAVTSTTDSCVGVDPDIDGITIPVPQNTGAFSIVVHDSSPSSYSGSFNIGYALITGTLGDTVNALLAVYATNAVAIQTGSSFVSLPDGEFGGWLPTTQNIAGAAIGNVIPYTVANMPTNLGPGNGLTQGTYILIVTGFISPEVISNLEDLTACTEFIAATADEQIYFTIGTVTEDCPTPCNEFVNPEDCPDAIGGCTDPEAINYDATATFDDGSCSHCTDGDYNICDCFPTDPDCQECDETALVNGESLRGFGAGFRQCGDDEEFCCTDPSACNYDPACIWGDNSLCEYESCDEDGCQGEDCDDEYIDECPNPNNPACDEDTYCVCCPDENGNLPAGCGPNEDDCVILGNCDGPVVDPDGDPDPEVPTVDFICDPVLPEITTFDGDNVGWLLKQIDFMGCAAENVRKMMLRLRSGVEYDRTDLIKLSLITYLFNKGSLDCIYDCNNYDEVKSNKPDMRPRDCTADWSKAGKKHFTGSSNYKKGDLVKYYYIKKGGLKFKYFYAGKDWIPGLTFPNNRTSQKSKTWVECVNVRAQAGGNPDENYFQTFYEFMTRFCKSCEVVTRPEAIPPPPIKNIGDFSTGIMDDDGNEIIF